MDLTSTARNQAAWHPDGGALLAAPGTEGDVVLYERMSWDAAFSLGGQHAGAVSLVAFSKNGARRQPTVDAPISHHGSRLRARAGPSLPLGQITWLSRGQVQRRRCVERSAGLQHSFFPSTVLSAPCTILLSAACAHLLWYRPSYS